MVLVICDCNVGFEGERYPRGVECDLPEGVVASLGGRAKLVEPAPLEAALAPLVDSQGETVQLPPGDPAVAEPLATDGQVLETIKARAIRKR